MGKEAWFCPSFVVCGFFPTTTGSVLANSIKKVVAEEGEKINMKIKIVETAGPSLASILTRPKLGGCIFPDCDFKDTGVDRLRRGANYTGTCNVEPCEDRYRVDESPGLVATPALTAEAVTRMILDSKT